MSEACQCKVTNGSGQTITKLVLYHAPGVGLPGTFVKVLEADNLADGATTPVAPAAQLSEEGDWWAGGVLFAGDTTPYLLANGLTPFAGCETPANGSAAIQIGKGLLSSVLGYGLAIQTFNNADFTDDDGVCAEQLITREQLEIQDEIAEEIVDLILDALV